jgi:pimeloyl-ACP methyl ester carboxylesterase
MRVQSFEIQVADSELDDLKKRLIQTRWPDEIHGADWSYGTNMAYLRELVDYWSKSFDWRAQERVLNSFSHFKAEVDGLDIHFIHERGKGPNPMPLVVTHGWPSTFCEMLKIIPMLTDPERYGGDPRDSFDVVVPSLPGYGFSDKPEEPGMNTEVIASMWVKLMEGLGYSSFAAQGGDIGASVTGRLGFDHPEKLIGIHLTMVAGVPYQGEGATPISDAERAMLAARELWVQEEGGYGHMHGTKPQTLAYSLNDSPAGLAGWIVEKFRAWSDCNGDVESRFTKDELLTNITIYWLTQTINSSMRLYYEGRRAPWNFGLNDKVKAPCGIARFKGEVNKPLREWVSRHYDVRRFTEIHSGGHFAAEEEPGLLVEDVRAFFRTFR